MTGNSKKFIVDPSNRALYAAFPDSGEIKFFNIDPRGNLTLRSTQKVTNRFTTIGNLYVSPESDMLYFSGDDKIYAYSLNPITHQIIGLEQVVTTSGNINNFVVKQQALN